MAGVTKGAIVPHQILAEIETRYVPPKIPCIMHAQLTLPPDFQAFRRL